jgi:hypothetical protein
MAVFPSPSVSESLRFSITGPIVTWEPFGRWLRIGARNFWVAPGVAVAGLAPGALVTAIGYQEDLTARWIVTTLTLDAPPRPRIDGEVSW